MLVIVVDGAQNILAADCRVQLNSQVDATANLKGKLQVILLVTLETLQLV